MYRRLLGAFDRFVDVRDHTDRDVASLARQLDIDIAVDLKGFTEGGRPGILAERAAPLQASYLGYPGTMGAPYIDYLIADRVLVPPQARRFFAEKIVHLPHSYQVNDSRRAISSRRFTRQALGLPEQGFVFCCFNNSYKILPVVFDRWMRILHRVPGSVLWLMASAAEVAANLRTEATQRGIDPARLVFASRLSTEDHLARHAMADLFLDTLPYNAHTTASDALWAGLPVLTQAGSAFAGRVAASLLAAIGLPELIAPDGDAYETLAVTLANDAERLAAIRRKLAANRETAPLFDTPRFARALETAYLAMHARHHAGLPPTHLEIADHGTA